MIKQKIVELKDRKNYKINAEYYNSTNEMVRDLKNRKITDSLFDDMTSKYSITKSWHGVASYEEAINLLNNGYQPAVERLKKNISTNLSGVGKRITFHNNVVGFAPVVPLAIMGVPNSMIDTRMTKIKSKVIDLYIDGSITCSTDEAKAEKAQSKILSYVLKLEQQGYRFNIYMVSSYSGKDDADILCVKVKDANLPMDLQRISFPLVHTAFQRVICFDWYSRFPNGEYRSGYGRPLNKRLSDIDLKIFTKKFFGENAKFIPTQGAVDHLDDIDNYLDKEILNASKN